MSRRRHQDTFQMDDSRVNLVSSSSSATPFRDSTELADLIAVEKKSVLITGCSSGGIGHALAREFHARGFRVFATARSISKMSDLKEGLGIECLELSVDDPKSIQSCYEAVQKLLNGKGLDYLINNAGIAKFAPAIETTFDDLKTLLDTNFIGAVLMCTTFIPLLLRSKGTIVNHGSQADQAPVPWNSAYSASKAALHAYSRTLRLELAPLGVNVVYLHTGKVQTHILPGKPILKPDSLYESVRNIYEERVVSLTNGGISAELAAKRMADGILAKQAWSVAVGGGAKIAEVVGWLDNFLPFDVWGFLMRKEYKLDQIKEAT